MLFPAGSSERVWRGGQGASAGSLKAKNPEGDQVGAASDKAVSGEHRAGTPTSRRFSNANP